MAEQDNAAGQDSPGQESPDQAPAAEPAPAPAKASRRFSPVGWLALLLVAALVAGAALVGWPEYHKREQALAERISALESAAGSDKADLNALGERWGRELRTGLSETEAAAAEANAALNTRLRELDERLSDQQQELARFSANDRDSWLMAEAEYLLRLANQRLIMAGDAEAAQALLVGADRVLRELDDIGLHDVRAAVASDLAAVRAIPRVDIEGIYLRLAALSEQAGKLVIFSMQEQPAMEVPDAADTWQDRFEQGYRQALAKLSEYIIIRRRDVPMQALMDPQWEGLVRQNLRMLLEQAQVALLSGNQALYEQSLERAGHWVDQFIDSDEVNARAVDRELGQLAALNVAVPLPDISGSANALDKFIEQRLRSGGGE